ncbi:MAG: dockerin type I repeat-containing protein [Oscillospiraceae bacterium]|nr:dockerin type I repeat-containing protein [Oscillospiraceae bacterium]
MKKLKKRKLALATAIATLTASLSVFSSVPTSAEVWQSGEMVVIDVTDNSVLIAYSEQRDVSRRDMLCSFYTLDKKSPAVAPIAEQVKYGDLICFTGEDLSYTEIEGINDMSFGDGAVAIVGSALDTSSGNFGSVTVDDQTFVQITGADGTRYVFENGADYREVTGFLGWEYSGSYTGINPYSDTTEYSEELANRYSKESGRPIWVLSSEDGEVNSDSSGVPVSAEWNNNELFVISTFPSVISSDKLSVLVAYPQKLFESEGNSDYLMDELKFHFYVMDMSTTKQLKYGDVLRYSDEVVVYYSEVCGVNVLELLHADTLQGDDASRNAVEVVGSVFDTPSEHFGSITVDDQTFLQITDRDGTKYVFEDGISYTDLEEFALQNSNEEYYKENGHPIWVLPNEDGDVNSDDKIDSADAAVILEEIALNAVGETGRMNASENQAADVNGDGVIDAQDAAIVLSYASEVGSGMLEDVTLKAYAAK